MSDTEFSRTGAATSNQIPPITTPTGQQMHGSNYRPNEPVLANGETQLLAPAGWDEYSLTEAERKQYGLRENEERAWIRCADYWGSIEFKDRGREWLREGRGDGRRIILEKGKPIFNGDLILAARPRVEQVAESADEAEEFVGQVTDGDVEGVPRWRLDNNAAIREYAQRQHDENLENGLIGPTSGMDFERVYEQKGRDGVEREEAFYRNGGRHIDATQDTEARTAEAKERTQNAKRGKASMGWSRELEANAPAFLKGKSKQ